MLAVRQLAEDVSGDVAAACRYHDISRNVSYRWKAAMKTRVKAHPQIVEKSSTYAKHYPFGHSGRWKRYEKQHPGHYVQIGAKYIDPITTSAGPRKPYDQYSGIDGCTRLRVLRANLRSDRKSAIRFRDSVLSDLSRLPFGVEKIQTDNGAEFQSSFLGHVLDQGIGHIYIHPATWPRAG